MTTGGSGATDRLEHSLARSITIARLVLAIANAVDAVSMRRHVRNRTALASGVGLMVGHAVWAVRDLASPSRALSRHRAATDLAVECTAMVSEAMSWRARAIAPDPTWSQSYGAAVNAWLPFQLSDQREGRRALAVGIITLLASTSGRSALDLQPGHSGQRVAEAIGLQQSYTAGRAFIQIVHRQASELDDARASSLREARRLEAEREREHEFRLLHDSALQILEAVAGGWIADQQLLRRRLDFEIEGLTRTLRGEAAADLGLELATQGLAAEFELENVAVDIAVEPDVPQLPYERIHALVEACREALRNVAKHALVNSATVRVGRAASGIEVVIADTGCGFDMAQVQHGFGIPQSIRARLRDVAGKATIESCVGRGTKVTLWVPT